jgi:hypothetical protein
VRQNRTKPVRKSFSSSNAVEFFLLFLSQKKRKFLYALFLNICASVWIVVENVE